MKKSKILMPLTGIAAIGAFAPVVAMTGCSHSYKIFDASTVKSGVLYNSLGDFCNIIGVDTLNAAVTAGSLKLDIGGKLDHTWVEDHVVYHSWTAQGKNDKKENGGTLLYLEELTSTKVEEGDITPGKTAFYAEDATFGGKLKVNTKMFDDFKAGTENVTFKFTITYEEFDKDKDAGGKSLGKQDITYEIVLCPNKNSLPRLTVDDDIGGLYTKTTFANPALTGYSFDANTKCPIKVELKNKTQIDIYEFTTQFTGNFVSLESTASVTVAQGKDAIELPVKYKDGWTPIGDFNVKTDSGKAEFRLVCTPQTINTYVLPSWEIGSMIDGGTVIKFTARV